jgi:ferredoxin--NADP+ reductase
MFTKKYPLPTQATFTAIMLDRTGMCGASRVSDAGQTKCTCIDGPEFDAHQIDFDELIMRLGGYSAEEKLASERYL